MVKFNPSQYYNLINVYNIKKPSIDKADEIDTASDSDNDSDHECKEGSEKYEFVKCIG